MTKQKVVIPVEIKYRELSAKLFLAAVLAGRGYDVYLGNKIQHTALDKIDPDVYFETGARQHESRFRYLRRKGISTLVLETEGQAFSGADQFAKNVDEETLEYTDCYCAWGSISKNVVEKISPETRVELTGNPRFDLIQKPHRNIYYERAGQLNETYDDYILFNGNYSNVNGEEPIKKLESYSIGDHPIMDELKENLKMQAKIFGRFLTLIAETAEEFPDRSVVIRPHPGEDPTFYENSLYAHDNVYIDKRFEARPWIVGAEAIIHNSCTTGATSALLNTPVISYVPNGWEISETPNIISERCTTATEVFETVRYYLNSGDEFTLDTDAKAVVRSHIDNIDYLSAERIADVVDSVTAEKDRKDSLDIDRKLALRRAIVRTIGSRRFEELWVKRLRGESRHKFEYTSTAEVESIVEQFTDEIRPAGLEFDRLPYMVNGFRVRTVE
jgi:surface carbohydrate biosynthesis protein